MAIILEPFLEMRIFLLSVMNQNTTEILLRAVIVTI